MKFSAAILLLAVLGLTAICYMGSLHGGWTFDDLAIRVWLGPGLSDEAIREFGIHHRPLLWLTYWLNMKRGGLDNTFVYHVTNLIFHLLSVGVVFGICRKILKSNEAAAFGALIFGIHPFFTSAVDYIDGRGSIMAAFFVLLTAWLLIQFQTWRKWPLAAISLACAVACKEEAAVFLILALGYAIVTERKWLSAGIVAAMVAGLAGLIVLVPYVPTVFTSKITTPVPSLLLNGFDILTRNQQIQAVFNGFSIHVLGNLVWPHSLNADPAPIMGWGKLLISAATLAALASLVLWRKPSAGVRLGAAALLASPMLGASVLMLADATFEYRSYICGLGVALLCGSFLLWMSRWPQTAAAISVAMILTCGLLTQQRHEVWRTSLGVWEEAYRLAPERVRSTQNYSVELMAIKQPDEAIRILKMALEKRPELRGANANLSLAMLQLGKNAEAEYYAQKGLPIPSAYIYLALSQLALGKRVEALAAATKAVDLDSRSPDAWGVMAQVMAANGKNYDSYLAAAHERGLIQIAQQSIKH